MTRDIPESVMERARRKARENDAPRYIVELDDGESRVFTTCGDDYLDSAEFYAFDGVLIATVYPDGETEYT